MKRALISDIHANLEALKAVRRDIRESGADNIVCLGDIIGWGPKPAECLNIVMFECCMTLKGHWEQALFDEPMDDSPGLLEQLRWTRAKLNEAGLAEIVRGERLAFLRQLPDRYVDGPYMFVHGSPRDPINEYVFPEDVYNERKMDALFGRIDRYCFQGHTHIPGVFTQSGEFIPAEECEREFSLGNEKAMINVGSVGQPRDGDNRACYVILDEERDEILFRRVPYEFDAKI